MVDVDRGVELAAGRQVERDPLGALGRRLYQTELVVCTPHADSRSPGSTVAPTVVPLIEAGRLRIGCALARSSFAGAGTAGAAGVPGVACASEGGDNAMVSAEAPAAHTIAGAAARPSARAIALMSLRSRSGIGC